MNEEQIFKELCPNYPYLPTILPASERIIALGDIHGDYELAIKLLKIARVIDDSVNWIGGDTTVVQVGDQNDRCRPYHNNCAYPDETVDDEASDIKIFKLFTNLHKQAIKEGGAVFSLFGNHEYMNHMGNMSYVSFKGLKEFENYEDPEIPGKIIKNGLHGRKYAFSPGKEIAKFMACTRQSILIIGSNLFVHAGVLPEYLMEINVNNRDDLSKINIDIRKWLLGKINSEYVEEIINGSKYSMFWTRLLGKIPPGTSLDDPQCLRMTPALELLQVDRMLFGHTPQFYENKTGINSSCDNKLIKLDTGSSKAFAKFVHPEMKEFVKPQVVEILRDGEEINILK